MRWAATTLLQDRQSALDELILHEDIRTFERADIAVLYDPDFLIACLRHLKHELPISVRFQALEKAAPEYVSECRKLACSSFMVRVNPLIALDLKKSILNAPKIVIIHSLLWDKK